MSMNSSSKKSARNWSSSNCAGNRISPLQKQAKRMQPQQPLIIPEAAQASSTKFAALTCGCMTSSTSAPPSPSTVMGRNNPLYTSVCVLYCQQLVASSTAVATHARRRRVTMPPAFWRRGRGQSAAISIPKAYERCLSKRQRSCLAPAQHQHATPPRPAAAHQHARGPALQDGLLHLGMLPLQVRLQQLCT